MAGKIPKQFMRRPAKTPPVSDSAAARKMPMGRKKSMPPAAQSSGTGTGFSSMPPMGSY